MWIARGRALMAVAMVVSLAACTPADAETDPAPAAPVIAGTPAAPVFTPVSTCSELLGPVLEAEILGGGYVLFSSTPGAGIHYPISSTQTTGSPLSCWYGVDGLDLSTFEIAAQLIRDRVSVESALAGFVSSGDETVTTWVKEGSPGGEPAVVHVVRDDSWLTAFSAYGGAEQVATMTRYLTTVAENVYGT
ncbi:hypothetical protein M2152_002767 [Microbacteriaceae bacterium SG_E_30_P1]|uniref:DUF3558 domain-containing protein n=1 Tax=Antiquaquibacter oligotrophicus TaxID=2880260 RepID=A0ABT6KRJ0_9MICO|nr:hypothetical protein [Antiquaquibacter oligotrophicus]MDH6182585.1 hypothetical protein [Antiquaquibacter oligotrophicus]UDF14448.1 hypothetical protein LH407_06200 [Antiquaquibacter oligotrophicus]